LYDGEVEDYEMTVADGVNVSGRVFIDADSNTLNDPSETGIVRHTVVLYDNLFDTCRSTYTNSNGDYRFSAVPDGGYQVYQAAGETVPTPQSCDPLLAKNPPNYTSTTPDSLTILVTDADVVDQNFGEAQGPTFEPNHQSEILPGAVAFYTHVFSSPVAGSVQFNTDTDPNNSDLSTSAGWNHLYYLDANCDGALSASEASATIAGQDYPVNSGDRLCIVNKVFAPTIAALNEQYRVTTIASFTYAGGIAGTTDLSVTDLTTTSGGITPPNEDGPSRLTLRKTVENTSLGTAETETINQANPGNFLVYRLYYENIGTGPINDLSLNDSVPPYTGLVANSVKCDDTPTDLNCSATTDGVELNWGFTGVLNGGSSGFVSYEVMVDQ
jgi:uncharacterized repeat protein (TIGR01451 family)